MTNVAHPSATDDDRNVLAALAAGKVPPHGWLFFGRKSELGKFDRDLARVGSGGAAMRFIVGDMGSGKTALLAAMARSARRQGFVTLSTEFSRDRLLHGRTGEGRGLIADALRSLKTPGMANAMALDALVGGFRDRCNDEAGDSHRGLGEVLSEQLAPLELLPRGSDFAKVIKVLASAAEWDPALASKARRWLFADYDSATEARRDLGVSNIIGDDDFWIIVRLWASFVRLAGRPGLLLLLDEGRFLPELQHSSTRDQNFAQLATIYNDVFQGSAPGVSVIVAATPRLLTADFNGMCSEPGLGSCLQNGALIGRSDDLIDSVAIRIVDLNQEESVELLIAVRGLIEKCQPEARLISVADIPLYLESVRDELGGQQFPLPRRLIQPFLNLHNKLDDHPDLPWEALSGRGIRHDDSAVATAIRSGEFAEGVM
jgi:hypothetical protein